MDSDFSPADRAFRERVRRFIADHYPARLRELQRWGEAPGKADFLEWHRILAAQGWVAPDWPTAWGGAGWTALQKYLWSAEQARADTIPILPFGIDRAAPLIYTFGSRAQQERLLPGTYHGEIWWCQGFAEPGAGSDLAGVQTRALRQGDHYLVTGHKTWVTLAQHADWGFFLVRTETVGDPQEGLTLLLIDMTTPGIARRPIASLDGAHELYDVFLDNVQVPAENRILPENQGWAAVEFLLAHQSSGSVGVAEARRDIARIRQLATSEPGDQSEPLLADPFFKRKVAELEIALTALEYTELRSLTGQTMGNTPALQPHLLRIKGAELRQRTQELALEAAGHYGAPAYPGFRAAGDNSQPIGPVGAHGTASRYFDSRKLSLQDGSAEIERDILAGLILGQ